MVWNIFKGLLSSICILCAILIQLPGPIALPKFIISAFLLFMTLAMWVDYQEKPQEHEIVFPLKEKIRKFFISGLLAFFVGMLIWDFADDDFQIHWGGLLKLIGLLFKAM
jgi:hypothetical protein